MSEYWDGVIALAGVTVGFLLTYLWERAKSGRRKDLIKKALYNELTNALEILERAERTQTGEKSWLPSNQFPFITETYDAVKVELASIVEQPRDLWLLQKTYAKIRNLNLPFEECPEGYVWQGETGERVYYHGNFSYITVIIQEARQCLSR